MTEHGEIDTAGREFARLAVTAMKALRAAAAAHARGRDRADRLAERATRETERAQRDAERAQRMRERDPRIAELDARRELHHEHAAALVGQHREDSVDRATARDMLAARWAAAQAVRHLDPAAAAAWDAAMRDAGVDPGDIRTLADAATRSSENTGPDPHARCGEDRQIEPTTTRAETPAGEVVDAATQPLHLAPPAGAEPERGRGEGRDIGDAIAATEHDSGVAPAGPASGQIGLVPVAVAALAAEAEVAP